MHLILIALAAITNSIMDTLVHHWGSIRPMFGFVKRNDEWWNPALSWANKYRRKLPVQLSDAWHFFKMLMLLFWAAALIWIGFKGWMFEWYIDIPLMYPAWNGTFELFYKYIWVKKKK